PPGSWHRPVRSGHPAPAPDRTATRHPRRTVRPPGTRAGPYGRPVPAPAPESAAAPPVLVALTPEGRRLTELGAAEIADRLAALAAPLDADEQALLRTLTARILAPARP
ncbi:hypothetical protein ACGFMP_07800, partial [Streptomyces sp. NPDC049040]